MLGTGCVGGEHWISSTKLLKLAQLYPVYCTVVLMAVSILGNLLIKKVLPVIILNNNKYSGPCTPSRVFFRTLWKLDLFLSSPIKFSTYMGKL